MRPTQPVKIVGNVSIRHLVPWPSLDIYGKFYGDRPRVPSGGVVVKPQRGIAEYSDFGPIEGYISETVQDMRSVSIVVYEFSIGTKIGDLK